MNNEALIAMFGFLTLMGGIIKLLMGYNYKLQMKLQNQKRENTQKSIEELKLVMDDFKKELNAVKIEMRETNSGFKSTQNSFGKISNALTAYIETNNQRFDKIQTEIVELSKNVTMYRTKKNENKRD